MEVELLCDGSNWKDNAIYREGYYGKSDMRWDGP